MRILLIAYEFPPSPSPQSLRWARLAREMVRHGAELRVLTVQRDGEQVRLPAPPGLFVDRTPPGAASGLVAHLRSQEVIERTGGGRASVATGVATGGACSQQLGAEALNWKGRLVEVCNRIAGLFAFPDPYGQWAFAARLRLGQLLDAFEPDLVISSHEPATTLELGRLARARGFPWLADLGDPVLSNYTPGRWRRRARRVEAWTCRNADHVTVTTAATRDLLAARHGIDPACFTVIPQGYDAYGGEAAGVEAPVVFDPDMLELVYTGSFYAFRRPQALVEGVLACDGARLTIATRTPPDWLREVAAAWPGRVRLAGFLTHAQALALQRGSDVLVNIANDDEVQIPGKVFEYLGALRPVLHIGSGQGVGELLLQRGRGLVVPEHPEAVRDALEGLLAAKRGGVLARCFDLRADLFPEFEWAQLGARMFAIAKQLGRPRD